MSETPTHAREGELLPPVPGTDIDTSVLTGLGLDLVRFFTVQLPTFFVGAKRLEEEALEAERFANTLTISNQDEHQAALEFIKSQKQAKRGDDTYWDITVKFHTVHSRMTQRRGITTGARERAIRKAESTATYWTRQEEARVRAENERLQREADEKARLEQEAKAAEIEREALARDEASTDLSPREQTFVALVVGGQTPGRAAKISGFKDAAYGDRLMAMPKIQQAIEAKQQAAHLRQQADAVRSRPVEPAPIERVQVNVGKVKGLSTRLTKTCVVFDVAKWRQAVKAGDIPIGTAVPDQSVLNGYAKAMGKKINAWPGCRYEEKEGMAG